LFNAWRNKGKQPEKWTAEAQAEWDKIGADRGYHYFGSAKIYALVGAQMAQSMAELMK
jgi:hypothetical protein